MCDADEMAMRVPRTAVSFRGMEDVAPRVERGLSGAAGRRGIGDVIASPGSNKMPGLELAATANTNCRPVFQNA
jgi:hypothetical protein